MRLISPNDILSSREHLNTGSAFWNASEIGVPKPILCNGVALASGFSLDYWFQKILYQGE